MNGTPRWLQTVVILLVILAQAKRSQAINKDAIFPGELRDIPFIKAPRQPPQSFSSRRHIFLGLWAFFHCSPPISRRYFRENKDNICGIYETRANLFSVAAA